MRFSQAGIAAGNFSGRNVASAMKRAVPISRFGYSSVTKRLVYCRDTNARERSTTPEIARSETSQLNAGSNGTPAFREPQLECTQVGMDDVECYFDDDDVIKGVPGQREQEQLQLSGPLSAVLLISPFAFWGTSMVAMKGLMTVVSPLLMGSFRLLPAGMVLVGWAAFQGRPQPSTATAWAWILAFALVDGAAFQGFLAEGLQRCPAGLGSVIIDSQPLSVAVLAAILFGERLTPAGIAGLAIGVLGLLMLELPEQDLVAFADSVLHLGNGSAQLSEASATFAPQLPTLEGLLNSGELQMLGAAQAMAVGTVMVRYVTRHNDPVMATGWHMILGGIILLGMALQQDPSAVSEAIDGLGPQDIASGLYVSLLGGAASYGIFFWLASSKGNLTSLSSLTFLTPVFASVTGYFVLNEVLTLPQIIGGAITLSAVILINGKKQEKMQKLEGRQ